MLGVALVQCVGRLGVAVLDDLELALNQSLSAERIRVTGLSGSWRLLNPIVSAAQIDFPAGQLADVTVEIDWLESLIRNRLVTRRLSIARGVIAFEPDGAGGWRLVGVAGGGDFDLSGLVYHSDQLQIAASIVLRDATGATAAAYSLDYLAINRGGWHRHRLRVSNPLDAPQAGDSVSSIAGCGELCSARFELQSREGLWPLWPDNLQVFGEVEQLEIPSAALGKFTLAQLVFDWHQGESGAGGSVSLDLQDVELPGDVGVSVRLSGRVSGSDGAYDGVIDRFSWAHDGPLDPAAAGSWELPELRLRVEESFAEVWAGSLDLALAAEFFEGALAGVELPSRWLRELNLDATALNVRGRLDWPSLEMGFTATLANLDLDGYKGAPYMRGGSGELIGYDRGMQFSLNSQNMVMQFPATFRDKWELAYAQGVVQMWFKDGYIGLRGPSVRIRTANHRAAGSFAITRPSDRREERLTLLIDLDDMDLALARTYVPHTLSKGLARWLSTGPREGVFRQPRFGYHGHVHPRPGVLSRRIELTSGLDGARVRYHADWPEIAELSGRLVVAGSDTRMAVFDGRSAGARLLAGSSVILRNNADYADVKLVTELATEQALNFIRDTPLRDSMTFVEPDWSGDGLMALAGDLHIPLGADDAQDELQVDLNIGLRQADLVMPQLRLGFRDLQGDLRYRYPNTLEAAGVSATAFGAPAVISARNADQFMVLRVEGSATHEDVLHVLELEDPAVAAGRMDFVADLFMGGADELATRLDITTDLLGASLDLPGEFAKAADVSRPLAVSVEFLDAFQRVSFTHAGAQGWLHIDERPLRGAVGFNLQPPELSADADYLLLTGQVDGFALDAVVPDDGDTREAVVPVKLANLRVGAIALDDLQITDAILNGDITSQGFSINVASAMIGADFRLDGDQPLLANVDYIALPESEDADADPLRVAIIPDLPAAQVQVQSLRVGDFDFGRWSFGIDPAEDSALFTDLQGDLHGVRVSAPDGVRWSAADNRSYFAGEVSVGDLAEVLPHWDYAPSLETESGSFAGEVSWSGSPANVDVLRLVGTAELRAKNGRFVDVDSGGGAVRIFSLMNFNTIAKRMRGDFSDLTGKGLAFDKLKATISFAEGQLEFVESLKVTGSGSEFEVGGRVNLNEGTLDNEMIVTLPVSKSLPWYGVYLALANPLAGAGIIVGERVLRKPMEQFSSAKYVIGGTIAEPTVNLVSVFDTSMDQAESKQAPADVEPVLDTEQNATTVADEQETSEI
jgi:uncharacterized protein YhdP